MSDDLLSPEEVAGILGVTTDTLYRWRRASKGPPYKTRGLREIVYERSALLDWADANQVAYSLPAGSFPLASSEG